jgi:Tfp pilus assembly protein PilP
MMKKIIGILIIANLLIPVGGCGKGKPPAQKPAAEQAASAKIQTPVTEAQGSEEIVKEEYSYDSKGRRDPFLPLIAIQKEKVEKKKGAKPTESFSIDEINLLAIAWDKDRYYALIMLPDKKTFTITEGMTLGLEGGKVEKITKDSVLIREYVKDYRGNIQQRDTVLKLHKGEEE